MPEFPLTWTEFLKAHEFLPENDAYNMFLSNFPKSPDVMMPSHVPWFREPLIEYYQENKKKFEWYAPLDYAYRCAAGLLEQEIISGRLNLEDFGHVVDFGCGLGISSIVLSLLSDNVIALEHNPNQFQFISGRGFLPEENLVCAEGVSYMQKMLPGTIDLVICYMFGWNGTTTDFARRFKGAADHALKTGGKIIIQSDLKTIDTVREVFNLPYMTEYAADTVVYVKGQSS